MYIYKHNAELILLPLHDVSGPSMYRGQSKAPFYGVILCNYDNNITLEFAFLEK